MRTLLRFTLVLPWLVSCDTHEPAPPDTRDATAPEDTADTSPADTADTNPADTADTADAADAHDTEDTEDTEDAADTTPAGCCAAPGDCDGDAVCVPGDEGRPGRCVPVAAEGCWVDEQCPEGASCEGEIVCPCGALCVRADAPGVCVGPGPRCCVDDLGCGEGELCAEVEGGSGTCKPAAGLGEGRCWTSGDCPPLRPKGPACLGARVCPCGALCILEDEPGLCFPAGCCLSDRDCSGREECAPALGAPGTCKNDEMIPPDGCWADDDCEPDERCLGERVCPCEALCVIADAPGACREGNCCLGDADCGPGEECAPATDGAGTCKAAPLDPGRCWAEDDCEAGQVCAGASVCPCESSCLVADEPGTCRPPAPPTCCWDDADCEAGQVCARTGSAAGTCQPAKSLGEGQCWMDDDCEAGRRCLGARVCPCGALCILADEPGRCGPLMCEAVDPLGFGACDMVIGVVFDGHRCVVASGCGCGEQCGAVFPDMETCLAACAPVCVTLDPTAYGLCAMVLGVVFDGRACVTASGCSCGADCGLMFTGHDACERACGLACETIAPGAFGLCERVLGWGFDGASCAVISGCSCGERCDLLYPSREACERACE